MTSSTSVNRRALCKNACLLSIALSTVLSAQGQAPTPTPAPQAAAAAVTAYDVVSIKQNKSGSGSMSISGVTNSFKGTNLSLPVLLINCYSIREDLISGLPPWTRSARFDIYAKMLSPDLDAMNKLTGEQRRAMLLAILQDRFHLQAHLETKTLPVFDLVAAKGGPKFTGATAAATHAAMAKNGLTTGGSMLVNNGELTANAVPISSLAYSLSGEVGRTIIDKTGLTGKYDFELKWTPEGAAASNADNGQTDQQSSASSLFTALQEQLGLKLQSSKGPVETLVVDHIEMPSEN